jgi:rubrerythrin
MNLGLNDIIEFAIRIEDSGEKFYRHAAAMSRDDEISAIFTRLANEEVYHKKFFMNLFSGMEKHPPMEVSSDDNTASLREYIDVNDVFSVDKEQALSNIISAGDALDFAMKRELGAVLYYQEMKKSVTDRYSKMLDKIIETEWRHFKTLTDVKKKFLRDASLR